jgi:hypothetical protein
MAVAGTGVVSLDCAHARPLAEFWAGMLGGEIVYTSATTAVVRTEWVALSAVEVAAYEQPTWPEPGVPKQIHLEMTDFQTLTDAFAELERRADAASASLQAQTTLHTPVHHRSRMPLVAASVLTVLAVAAGAALLARDRVSGSEAGAPPATSTMPSAAARTTFQIPDTPEELAIRFRTVLGDTATFTVTDTGAAATVTRPAVTDTGAAAALTVAPAPTRSAGYTQLAPAPTQANGAAIVGTLTASGITGGFDLQIFRASPGDKAWCDDPDRSRCTVSRLADGSSLVVGREPLQGAPNAITYQVNLIRATASSSSCT